MPIRHCLLARIALAAAVAAALAALTIGCGEEAAEPDPDPADRFVGTWRAGASATGYVTCGDQSPQTVSLSGKVLTIEKRGPEALTLYDSALAGCPISATVSEAGAAVGTPGVRCTVEDDSGSVPRQIDVTLNTLELLALTDTRLDVEWQDTSRAPQQPECVTAASYTVTRVEAGE